LEYRYDVNFYRFNIIRISKDPVDFLERPVMINIQSKHGATIDTMSLYPDQKEIIFAPGTRFNIVSVKHRGNKTIYDIEEL
jgi:hypothetical protein